METDSVDVEEDSSTTLVPRPHTRLAMSTGGKVPRIKCVVFLFVSLVVY